MSNSQDQEAINRARKTPMGQLASAGIENILTGQYVQINMPGTVYHGLVGQIPPRSAFSTDGSGNRQYTVQLKLYNGEVVFLKALQYQLTWPNGVYQATSAGMSQATYRRICQYLRQETGSVMRLDLYKLTMSGGNATGSSAPRDNRETSINRSNTQPFHVEITMINVHDQMRARRNGFAPFGMALPHGAVAESEEDGLPIEQDTLQDATAGFPARGGPAVAGEPGPESPERRAGPPFIEELFLNVEGQFLVLRFDTLKRHSVFFDELLGDYEHDRKNSDALLRIGGVPVLRLGMVNAKGLHTALKAAIGRKDYNLITDALHSAYTLRFEAVYADLVGLVRSKWKKKRASLSMDNKAATLVVAQMCGLVDVVQESFQDVLRFTPLPTLSLKRLNYGSPDQANAVNSVINQLYATRDIVLGEWRSTKDNATDAFNDTRLRCTTSHDKASRRARARAATPMALKMLAFSAGIYERGHIDPIDVFERLSAMQSGLCVECYKIYAAFWQSKKYKMQALLNGLSHACNSISHFQGMSSSKREQLEAQPVSAVAVELNRCQCLPPIAHLTVPSPTACETQLQEQKECVRRAQLSTCFLL
ncbi:hypothetical protein OBBRIDRAFT_806537 [Obba rivulosa]|uniref:Uncharacterized protein n=1 Tax=Obba rivulosa TaxID=1052685 RepID=A0A8E2AM74_9APHY|nr:hypothetical protein OBBRIDRAFT_806537 [Obba rivulosa]